MATERSWGQPELFTPEEELPPAETLVPGFTLHEDYLSPQEEAELLTHIDVASWETDWRRRIQQYGLGYAEGHGTRATWLRPLPGWLETLAHRVQHTAH